MQGLTWITTHINTLITLRILYAHIWLLHITYTVITRHIFWKQLSSVTQGLTWTDNRQDQKGWTGTHKRVQKSASLQFGNNPIMMELVSGAIQYMQEDCEAPIQGFKIDPKITSHFFW